MAMRSYFKIDMHKYFRKVSFKLKTNGWTRIRYIAPPKHRNWSITILTHWGRDEMNNISQTTFSNVFSSMKMFEFPLKFHWSLFPRVQLTIFQHWFRKWLGAVQATSHYLNPWWLVYRRIDASLGLNKLNYFLEWMHCSELFYHL